MLWIGTYIKGKAAISKTISSGSGLGDSTRKRTGLFHIVEVQVLEVHALDRLGVLDTEALGPVTTTRDDLDCTLQESLQESST